MSLLNCEKCWNHPCTCGWQYRKLSEEQLEYLIEGHEELIKKLKKIIRFQKENPDAKYSEMGEKETIDDIKFMENLE